MPFSKEKTYMPKPGTRKPKSIEKPPTKWFKETVEINGEYLMITYPALETDM